MSKRVAVIGSGFGGLALAISIAILVVTSAWHTFGTDTAHRSQAVIAGFTVVAVCDMLHVLSFPGMPAFLQASSTNSTAIRISP